jgi:hypothetical protein
VQPLSHADLTPMMIEKKYPFLFSCSLVAKVMGLPSMLGKICQHVNKKSHKRAEQQSHLEQKEALIRAMDNTCDTSLYVTKPP